MHLDGEFLHLTVSQICASALYTSSETEMLVSHLKTEVSQNRNPLPLSLGKPCSTACHREMKMLRLGARSHSCSPEMLQTEWILSILRGLIQHRKQSRKTWENRKSINAISSARMKPHSKMLWTFVLSLKIAFCILLSSSNHRLLRWKNPNKQSFAFYWECFLHYFNQQN